MSRKSSQAQREMRRKQVAANLTGGMNYRDMAEALDVSIGTVANDVKIIMGRWEREQADQFNEWVALEQRRLDRLLNAIWDKALAGELGAIDRVLSIEARRAKLLGLDAPQKLEHTGKDGGALRIVYVNDWRNSTSDTPSGADSDQATPGTVPVAGGRQALAQDEAGNADGG